MHSMSLTHIIFGCIMVASYLQEASSFSWYSTITEWRDLAIQDKKMLTNIENMVKKGRSQINQLMQKIERYKKLSTGYIQALSKYPNVKISKEYANLLRSQTFDLYLKERPFNRTMVNSYQQSMSKFPKIADLNIVLRTLLTLQKSNNLNTKDLTNGYIVDTYTGSKLSPNGYYDIANMACTQYSFKQCIEWCQEARQHVNETGVDYTEDDLITLSEERFLSDRFSRLCQQSLNRTFIENASNSKLKCFLWNNFGHPLLILQPVRAELLSVSPTVVQFYDVITNQQIDYVKRKAMQNLGTAKTFERENKIDPQNYRVAHNCWLNDITDKTLETLNPNVEAITGLLARRSLELLQIANYGIGGHYYAHTDAMDVPADNELTQRNREATFMYYLSDVQYGGATVFVYPGVAIKPVKGSAVFWYNLEWNTGMSDKTTLHGGCPVVLGDKWVANKWIWETSRSTCEKIRFG